MKTLIIDCKNNKDLKTEIKTIIESVKTEIKIERYLKRVAGSGWLVGLNEFHTFQFCYRNDNIFLHFRIVIFHVMVDFLGMKSKKVS